MDRHTSHDVPDLLPLHMYDQNRAKIDASLKWLINKAYTSQVPKELVDPLPRSEDDTKSTVLINTGLLKQLANGLLYCLSVQNTFPHWNLSWKSHWSIIQALSKKSVYVVDEDDSMITQQDLVQTRPFNIRAHLALIDAMMKCYVMEIVTVDKVVQAVKSVAPINASKDLPFDVEDALLLWLNKVAGTATSPALVSKRGIGSVPSVAPVMDDLLKDIVDGQSLALLISLYCPGQLSLQDVALQATPDSPLSIADSMANLELVRGWCYAYLPSPTLHLTTEDLLYSPMSLKPNLLALLADLFYHLVTKPLDGVQAPNLPAPSPSSKVKRSQLAPASPIKSADMGPNDISPVKVTMSGSRQPVPSHVSTAKLSIGRTSNGSTPGRSDSDLFPVHRAQAPPPQESDLFPVHRAHPAQGSQRNGVPGPVSPSGSISPELASPPRRPRSRRGSREYSPGIEGRKAHTLHSPEDKDLIRQSILNWESKSRQPSSVLEEPEAEARASKAGTSPAPQSTSQSVFPWPNGPQLGSRSTAVSGEDDGLLSVRLLMNGSGQTQDTRGAGPALTSVASMTPGTGFTTAPVQANSSVSSGLSDVSLPVSVSASSEESRVDASLDSSVLETAASAARDAPAQSADGGAYTPFRHFARGVSALRTSGGTEVDTPFRKVMQGTGTRGSSVSDLSRGAGARGGVAVRPPASSERGLLSRAPGGVPSSELDTPRSAVSVAKSFVIDGTHTPETARAAGLPVVTSGEPSSISQVKVERNNNTVLQQEHELFPVRTSRRQRPAAGDASAESAMHCSEGHQPLARAAWETPSPSLKQTYLQSKGSQPGGESPAGLPPPGSSGKKAASFSLNPNTTSWEERAQDTTHQAAFMTVSMGSLSTAGMQPISKELADVKLQLKQNRQAIRAERENSERAKQREKEQLSREAFQKVVNPSSPKKTSPSSPVRRAESLHGALGSGRARPTVQRRNSGNLKFSRSDIRMSIENLAQKWQQQEEDMTRTKSYTSLSQVGTGGRTTPNRGLRRSPSGEISLSSSSSGGTSGLLVPPALTPTSSTETIEAVSMGDGDSRESLKRGDRVSQRKEPLQKTNVIAGKMSNYSVPDLTHQVPEEQSLDKLTESLSELQGEINRLSVQQEQIKALTLLAASSSSSSSPPPAAADKTRGTKKVSRTVSSADGPSDTPQASHTGRGLTRSSSGSAGMTRSSSGLLRSSQLTSVYGSNQQLDRSPAPDTGRADQQSSRPSPGASARLSLLQSKKVSASSPNVQLLARQSGGGPAERVGGGVSQDSKPVGRLRSSLKSSSSQLYRTSTLAEEPSGPSVRDRQPIAQERQPVGMALSNNAVSMDTIPQPMRSSERSLPLSLPRSPAPSLMDSTTDLEKESDDLTAQSNMDAPTGQGQTAEKGPEVATRPKRATWDMTTPRGGEVVNINAGPDAPGIGFTVVDEDEAAEIEDQRRKKIFRLQARRREELEKKREEREAVMAKRKEEAKERLLAEERQKQEEKEKRERLLVTHQKRRAEEELPPELRAAVSSVPLRGNRPRSGAPVHAHRASTGLMLDMRKSDFIDGLSNFGDLTQRTASPSDFAPSALLTSRSKASSGVGSTASGAADATVVLEEYSGPKLYVKPSSKSKSNRSLIINAISHCCLAGVVNEENKKRTVEELEAYEEAKHFLILFRDGHQQYRAIYAYFPDSNDVIKITGQGPKSITNKMIDRFYKYNSGARTFIEVTSTKHLSVSIDAVTIHNALWGKKVPRRQAPV